MLGWISLIFVLALTVGSLSALDPVFVFDPITREYRRLPTSGEKDIGSHQVGLGFDPSTGKRRCFEVTTLEVSSWRKLEVLDQPFTGKASQIECDFMISFDVCHEKFRKISFPKCISDFVISPRAEDVGQLGLGSHHDNNGQFLLPLRGCSIIVEHDNEQMRLWEVMGNKLKDLSIWFWDEHDTHVLWNPHMTYKVVGRLSREYYLLELSACYVPSKRANYLLLDIPGLPPMLITVRGYEPSLASPKIA
ncbi:hypothetical protein ACJRO7_032420 [Eucalyptus globulus]|uniref:F-box associated domain-containing protein n=1 Tax=Eucalyptus globulus TaxID=34317 RepID=A0ABD3JMX9_EUCGL